MKWLRKFFRFFHPAAKDDPRRITTRVGAGLLWLISLPWWFWRQDHQDDGDGGNGIRG